MDSTFYYDSLYDLAWYLVPFIIFVYALYSSWLKKVIGDKQAKRLNKIKTPLVVVLLCCAAYLFLKDDELNPEIVEFLNNYSSNINKNNTGTVYHMGMWSNFDSSPYEVGLWRIEQYEKSLANTKLPSTTIEFEDYPKEDWIEDIFIDIEKPIWLCDYDEVNCLNMLYRQSEEAIYLGDVFQKHIKRYDGVFNYTYFGQYLMPTFYAPRMMAGPSVDVLKIKLILNFHDFKLGYRETVVKELTKLLNHHKSVLAQTPYIITKVMSVIELQHIYKAAAFLISKTSNENLSVWKPYIDSLTQLEKGQLTFTNYGNHEFVSIYNTFQIAGVGGFKKELFSILEYLPSRSLYKPNRTVNLMFKSMTDYREQYELLGDRIIVHEKLNLDDEIKFDLSNPLGSILAVAESPKYLDLDVSLYDLEIFQRLTKHLYLQRLKSDKALFISPYTGKEGRFNGNRYCIDAHSKDDKPVCLSTI